MIIRQLELGTAIYSWGSHLLRQLKCSGRAVYARNLGVDHAEAERVLTERVGADFAREAFEAAGGLGYAVLLVVMAPAHALGVGGGWGLRAGRQEQGGDEGDDREAE
jgi:hypothetical protein